MTSTQIFFGSFIEILCVIFMLNLFDNYLQQWWKGVVVAFIVAAITVLTDITTIEFPFAGYMINYFSIILLIVVLYKRNMFYVIFQCLFGSAMLVLLEFIYIYVLLGTKQEDMSAWSTLLFHLIPILILTFTLSCSKKVQTLTRSTYNRFKAPFCFVFGNIFLAGLVIKYFWDTNRDIVYADFSTAIVFICLWWLFNAYLMRKMITELNQKKTIKLHEQYGEMTQRLLDELYSEQHDFRKHLQAIVGLTQISNPQQGLESICSYVQTLGNAQDTKQSKSFSFHMGNSAIDGLLYTKHKEAVKEEINFYYIPRESFPNFPCPLYELTELLGNLLDNAFDYVKALPPEERKILVRIDTKDEKPYIEVRNTYYAKEKENFEMMKKKGYSTKLGERRGYGLYNVKRICTKYHGHLDIFHQDGQLVLQALF